MLITWHFVYCPSASEGKWRVISMVSRWLWPGNRTYLELVSMVVTWWIVACLPSVGHGELHHSDEYKSTPDNRYILRNPPKKVCCFCLFFFKEQDIVFSVWVTTNLLIYLEARCWRVFRYGWTNCSSLVRVQGGFPLVGLFVEGMQPAVLHLNPP